MEKELIYYAGAAGCNGYVTYYSEYIISGKKNIVLKNATGYMKKALFDALLRKLEDRGYSHEIIIRSSSRDDIDGIIINETGISAADEMCFDSKPSDDAVVFDFARCLESSRIPEAAVTDLVRGETKAKSGMLEHMKKAKSIHDEWEKIYIDNMDFQKLNAASDALIEEIFRDTGDLSAKGQSKNTNRFFGTMLPDGTKNYINELTRELKSRIFIKGRPGTGKSTMLKKIRSAANAKGFDTETYYCSFDTDSLDMVIIRGLGICVFDSTAPHEMFPETERDSIFDVYDIAVKPGTDEKYSAQFQKIKDDYDAEISKARDYLRSALDFKEQREKIYNDNINSDTLSVMIKGILMIF